MADGSAKDERLRDVLHFNRGLDADWNSALLELALQSEAVDDGGEHAHVIGGRAIHSAVTGGKAAPDIAAAHDDGDLDS